VVPSLYYPLSYSINSIPLLTGRNTGRRDRTRQFIKRVIFYLLEFLLALLEVLYYILGFLIVVFFALLLYINCYECFLVYMIAIFLVCLIELLECITPKERLYLLVFLCVVLIILWFI
jgi:hypothetical protein